jgi:excisionase family DNA binding protein
VDDDDAMIGVGEAARLLNRSTEQVRRYLREGKLPGRRIGGQWFVERGALRTSEPGLFREAAVAYRPSGSRAMDSRGNTMEMRTTVENLIARINNNREAIRVRIGGDVTLDVTELIREDREEH